MKQLLSFLFSNKYNSMLFQQSKRYAGHSKWQNIKHIKEQKDNERAKMFTSLLNKMKVAITEGGSAKPSENQKLAQLIEQAKKVNMPVSTLNTFFERMRDPKKNCQETMIDIRGPGGCIIILHLATNNLAQSKIDIKTRIKKYNADFTEPSVRRMFNFVYNINGTKPDCNLDIAMENAINIGAEDVEEIKEEDGTYFKFKCSVESSTKITQQLQSLGYSIISTEVTYNPENLVELDEANLEAVDAMTKKLASLEGLNNIYHNIA